MLRELGREIWVADMDVFKRGFEIGARMTVVRLPEGGLFLHSPVALMPELRRGLDALGPVQFVVSPSRFHYEHLGELAAAYPDATVFVPPSFKRKVPGIAAPRRLADTPEPAWAAVLDQVVFRGSWLYNEVVFCHGPSRTLVVTDLCFNVPRPESPVIRVFARLIGIGAGLGPSTSFGWTARDRDAVRASLERILAWDFDRIVLSHGQLLESGGREAFRKAFAPFLA